MVLKHYCGMRNVCLISLVHIQNAGNIALILPMHIGKHSFHAPSDTVHIQEKSLKLL